MTLSLLVVYGSYRSDRVGIRLTRYHVNRFAKRGVNVELINAREVGLPMLDRMYKEYPKGTAPVRLEKLAAKIRDADGFVFVTGECNWGVQLGLKNLTDHFLEDCFWRPAAIASYSSGRVTGARANFVWHGPLSEMGMVVVSSTLMVGPAAASLNEDGAPTGDGGASLERAFLRFAEDLEWWAEATRLQRDRKPPPYRRSKDLPTCSAASFLKDYVAIRITPGDR